jgi:hypothetical protein
MQSAASHIAPAAQLRLEVVLPPAAKDTPTETDDFSVGMARL